MFSISCYIGKNVDELVRTRPQLRHDLWVAVPNIPARGDLIAHLNEAYRVLEVLHISGGMGGAPILLVERLG